MALLATMTGLFWRPSCMNMSSWSQWSLVILSCPRCKLAFNSSIPESKRLKKKIFITLSIRTYCKDSILVFLFRRPLFAHLWRSALFAILPAQVVKFIFSIKLAWGIILLYWACKEGGLSVIYSGQNCLFNETSSHKNTRLPPKAEPISVLLYKRTKSTRCPFCNFRNFRKISEYLVCFLVLQAAFCAFVNCFSLIIASYLLNFE